MAKKRQKKVVAKRVNGSEDPATHDACHREFPFTMVEAEADNPTVGIELNDQPTVAFVTIGYELPVEEIQKHAEKAEGKELHTMETANVVDLDQHRFNRTGMELLMAATLGNPVALQQAVEVEIPKGLKRMLTGNGFLPTARRMYLEGRTGQQIIEWIRDVYVKRGDSEEYGLERGKKIFGDVRRQMTPYRGKYTVEQIMAAPERTAQVAAQ